MADNNSLNVNIVTPDRQLFGAEVFSIVLPGSEGQLEILPGHQAIITGLTNGAVIIRNGDNQTNLFYVGDGFAEVRDNNVSILVNEANHYGELDRSTILEEFSAAAAMLEQAQDDDARQKAQKAVYRATVRKDILALISQLQLPAVTATNSDI